MIVTTVKYMITCIHLSMNIVEVTIRDKNNLILNERLLYNTITDIAYGLWYLLEYDVSMELKLPANNTQYGYMLYAGKSVNKMGMYHIILVRQNFTDKNDFVVADEFLETYQLKNIINDICMIIRRE